MNENGIIQTKAELKILEYKLDSILKHINKRINIVDNITKNELLMIKNLITKYDEVPSNWQLEVNFIENNKGDSENVQ